MLKIVVLLIIFVEPSFFLKDSLMNKKKHTYTCIYNFFFTVVQQFTHNFQKLL